MAVHRVLLRGQETRHPPMPRPPACLSACLRLHAVLPPLPSPPPLPPTGRGGNRWESPDGCLMFSVCKQLAIPGHRLPFVQYIVSLAVVQAVQAEARARLPPGKGPIDVRIKWPNDVYAGQLKLGGILCHSSYRSKLFHIIMGVGLNLSNRQPTTCVDTLIEQAAAAAAAAVGAAGGADAADGPQQQQQRQGGQHAAAQPAPVMRESLLAGILSRLEPMLELLAAEGFEPFEADYCRHWLHSDQQVGGWLGLPGRGRVCVSGGAWQLWAALSGGGWCA